ncbi:hypothetical protein LQZ24_05695 [Fructobacillus sp. M1-13]|uniref:Uncharacterized protein n=1 Tax=Fructobacillus papyriferae TaxID=2713171 RepID=A0ABS5QRJ9_9LACO|nr:hypothetical protein [Fructobacillus papyriferae]MBS9335026.1 hypothetical protein [Fructobacillus papyriferae]MCD2159488.1 hypothetical protein [Fructobacillus papyriferae]
MTIENSMLMYPENTQRLKRYEQLQDEIYAKRDEIKKMESTKEDLEADIDEKYEELGDLQREVTEL